MNLKVGDRVSFTVRESEAGPERQGLAVYLLLEASPGIKIVDRNTIWTLDKMVRELGNCW